VNVKILNTLNFDIDNRTFIDLTTIIILVLLFFNGLLFSGLPYGSDILIPITWLEFLTKQNLFFSSWIPLDSFGLPIPYDIPFNPVLYILSAIPINKIFALKAYVLLTILVAAFSMYLSTYKLSKRRNASLFASLIYIFNPLFLVEVYEGHHSIIFGYALAPLIFLTYENTLKNGDLQDIILFSLSYFLFYTSGHPETTYIFTPFLLLKSLFEVIFSFKMVGTAIVKKILRINFLAFLFLLMFGAYHFLTAFYAMPDVTFSVYNLGYTIEEAYYYVKDCAYISYFIPPLLLSAILFRNDKETLFLLISTIISIFIALGPLLTEQLFIWIWRNIPLFYIFRVPTRWLMMTLFSIAPLVGQALDNFTSFLKDEKKTVYKNAKNLLKNLRRYICSVNLRYATACFTLIWLIFSIGVASIHLYYHYYPGTYTLPKNYLDAYEKIKLDPEDFRVFSLPYPVGYIKTSWISNVDKGWVWDPALYSQAFTEKVVVTGWGGMTYTRDFLDYLFWLIQFRQTNDFMKIIGTFNVKYVVMHPHSTSTIDSFTLARQREFFLKQSGQKVVYQNNDVIILKNDYFTPHIFVAEHIFLVVGGLNAFTSLCEIDSFYLNQTVLVFANQLSQNDLNKLLPNVDGIIFLTEDGIIDLFYIITSSGIKIKPEHYGLPSSNSEKYWVTSGGQPGRDRLTYLGLLTIDRLSLTTKGNNEATIRFVTNSGGDYYIFLRIAYAPDRGKLSILIDNSEVLSIIPFASNHNGFRWTKAGPIFLNEGEHTLSLINDGSGFNDVDEIFIIPIQTFENEFNKLIEILNGVKTRIVYILEAENTFSCSKLEDWYIEPKDCDASNGCALVFWHEENSSRLSTNIFIPKEGRYMLYSRILIGPRGNFTVYVDDVNVHSIPCHSLEWGWKWILLGSLDFTKGNHRISIQSLGPTQCDAFILYSVEEEMAASFPSLIDVFASKSTVPVNYKKVGQSRYVINVELEKPSFVILSESYHPLWRAYLGCEKINSMISYSFVNGFFVNKTGKITMTIEFGGQIYTLVGGIISISSFGLATLYLCANYIPSIKRKTRR
jgi:hypothetical protein